jgi:type VI secretion system secreted protein Hcp
MKMAEMFLKFEGPKIEGESLDEALPIPHKNEIEIKAWSWKTENHVQWDVNQGGQSTKMKVNAIDLEKVVDKASHLLYQFCTNGKHIQKAIITARKNNGDQKVEYLRLTLEDVMVNEVRWAGQGDEQFLTENVQLSFAQFLIEYSVQGEDGTAVPAGSHGWHVQKQKAA